MQTNKSSLLEALLNVLIGALMIFIVTDQLATTAVLTVLSVVRMYIIRRLFTRRNV